MSDTSPERAAIDVLADAWTAGFTSAERDGFVGCCSAEVSYEDPFAVEPLIGTEALRAHGERLRGAFPGIRLQRPAPALVRGDHACVPWLAVGTNSRPLTANVPATDRSLKLHGVHYLELADGRVRRARGFFNVYDGAVQLGLLPARGGFGEAALMALRGFGLRL